MAKGKLQVGNVVPSYTETKSMVSLQVARTTKQLVAKEVSTLAVGSMEDILQCTFEKARTEGLTVVYNVIGQVLLYLLRRKVMDENS